MRLIRRDNEKRCRVSPENMHLFYTALPLQCFVRPTPGFGSSSSAILRGTVCSIPIGTTTFPNQLPEALLAANVGGLGVLLGKL